MTSEDSEVGAGRPIAPEQIGALVTIINLVRSGEALTRPDLGKVSKLGRSIVTQRVEQAIDLGYLADGDLGPSTGGRQPRKLRFRGELGCFLVIEFGALHVGVAILDLALVVRGRDHRDWDITTGPDASMEFAARLADRLLQEDGSRPVWGITVGVPGPVEFSTGRPIAPPIMPGWHLFNIRQWMEDRYGAPVFVDNEANLMALGEFHALGAWEQHSYAATDSILFVKVGTGIGAGLISEGHVHRGANGAAGDVGHIAITDRPDVVCRCGQRGCLEAVAGGWALARDGEQAAREGESPYLAAVIDKRGFVLPSDVVDGALNGDAKCVELVALSGRTVGEMLASVVNFFNPAAVAVGGSIASAGDLFLAAVRRTVYRRSLPLATRDLRIIPAVAEREAGAMGAGRVVAERVFHQDNMHLWIRKGSPREAIDVMYRTPSPKNPA